MIKDFWEDSEDTTHFNGFITSWSRLYLPVKISTSPKMISSYKLQRCVSYNYVFVAF